MSGNNEQFPEVDRTINAAYTDIVEAVRRLFRELAKTNHKLSKELIAEGNDYKRAILAAVEGLETLTDNIDAYLEYLPGDVGEALKVAAESAWQRLESSGVMRDGERGEPIDLKRHRIIKSLDMADQKNRIVVEVIKPGIMCRGGRLRDIAVVAGKGDG